MSTTSHTVSICTDLAAPADAVWAAVTSLDTFVHVARPVLRYPAAERHRGPMGVGDELVGWTFLFGVVPISRHRLRVVAVDPEMRCLDSDEGGGVVRSWRHHIAVTPIDGERCRYLDRIEIDAGVLTPVVVAFAHVFYRHRQRRWRQVAPLLAAVAGSPPQAVEHETS